MKKETKKRLEARLKRVSGQVTGIQRMMEEERYCIDVLTQLSAAKAALGKVSAMLLESHLQTCVKVAFESDDKAERAVKTAELLRVFDKNCNC